MINRVCYALYKRVGTPRALLVVVALCLLEITFGTLTRTDPYPFQFLSTVCNLLGFFFMFMLAIGQNYHEETTGDAVAAALERHHATLAQRLEESLARSHLHLSAQIRDHVTDKLKAHHGNIATDIARAAAATLGLGEASK